jgi:hypothetical protein
MQQDTVSRIQRGTVRLVEQETVSLLTPIPYGRNVQNTPTDRHHDSDYAGVKAQRDGVLPLRLGVEAPYHIRWHTLLDLVAAKSPAKKKG